ncbi:MAG: hypothetical protein MUP98_15520 [Candidatus Aminicenantes bacterium]|nr:hypothetical protein [Candidatus Aminicenantes bacterium]
MNRKKKQTREKNFLLLMGISLSLVIFYSGSASATVENNLIQPLSFKSIVNSNSPINVDGIAFVCGNSSKNTADTKTSTITDAKTTKAKSGKKTVTVQKNSTSRRRAIIDD